jgi:chromosome partitioning protein
MKTLLVNSQKGGSGKTTLLTHLAVEADRSGDGPIYLIDTDPQGTLSTWHERREAETPHRIDVPRADLPKALKALNRQAAYCFIDTAPSRGDETVDLFKLADLVLVPVRPSVLDMWAVVATISAVKRTKVPFLFVVNLAKTNTKATAQAIAALSHHGPVAQTFIPDRIIYSAAMTDGHAAQEMETRGPMPQEIAALWRDVQTMLNAKMAAHA